MGEWGTKVGEREQRMAVRVRMWDAKKVSRLREGDGLE